MIAREDVISCARHWLGTPWEHQGRVQGRGIDCVGLIVKVGQELGFSIKDIVGYSKHFPSSEKLQVELQKQLHPIEKAEEGDILLLSLRRTPVHLALLSKNSIIHVCHESGCIERILDDRWRKKIVSSFSYKEISWLH